MILIFSTSQDPSTIDVMRWIHHISDARVVRVNSDQKQDVELAFRDDDYHVRVGHERFRLAEVTSAWLRKGTFWFRGLFPELPAASSALRAHLDQRIRREDAVLRDHFHHVLGRHAAVLGSANGSAPNKLIVLERARAVGLSTPAFEIATSRRRVRELLDSSQTYVTKPMSDGVYLFDVDDSRAGYFSYTELLAQGHVDGASESLSLSLSPSLLQCHIDKHIELRVFFLEGQFHAWAIFSQNDEKTRVDCRKYNLRRPNRVVPYQLPVDVEQKLARLALILGLDTGSMDLIVDRAGVHHFLEVNPVGQFGALSEGCNHAIEKLIAQRLVAHES